MAGVYWIGQDGNTYMKGDEIAGGQVTKWIAPYKTPEQLGYAQIADPVNPPATTAPTSNTAAPAPVFNQAAVNNTQATIDQIPGLLAAALEAEGTRFTNANAGFNSQEAQRKTYDESTVTNQQNYDANFMDSIRAGIKGIGGLFALLRGTGAAGGSADDQVRDVVGGITANDIRAGADTQKKIKALLIAL